MFKYVILAQVDWWIFLCNDGKFSPKVFHCVHCLHDRLLHIGAC